jgi:hypothetical protein
MNDLIVRITRKRGLRQQFHICIESGGNHEKLLTSENYRDLDYAREVGNKFASLLGAALKDDT